MVMMKLPSMILSIVLCFFGTYILTTNGFLFQSVPRLAFQKKMPFRIASTTMEEGQNNLAAVMDRAKSLMPLEDSPSTTVSKGSAYQRTFDNDRTLWIGGLPADFNNDKFLELLKTHIHQKITGYRLAIYPNGQVKGFGFVELENVHDVEVVAALLRTVVVDGQKINAQRKVDEKAEISRTIFIGGIDPSLTEESLKSMLTTILGKDNLIAGLRIAKNVVGESRGFGFIDLFESSSASFILEKIAGYKYNDRFVLTATIAEQSARVRRDLRPEFNPLPNRRNAQPLSSSLASSPVSAATNNHRFQTTQEQQLYSSALFNPDLFSLECILKPNPLTTIYLKNIAWNITQTFLHEMITDLIGYDKYTFLFLYPDTRGGGGQTNKTAAMTAIGNTNHFGIAHIGFPTKEVAQKAINELHGLEVNGKVLFAEYLNPYNIRYVKKKLGFSEMSMMTKTSASRQYQPQSQSRQDQQGQQQRPRVPFSEFSRRMPMNNNQPSFPPRPMNSQNNHNNINHNNINNNHHNDNIPPQQPEQQQLLEQEKQIAEEAAPVEPQQSEPIPEPDQVEESQPTTSAPVGHQESVAFFHDSEPSPIFPREDITEETMTPPPLQHLQESFADAQDHHDDYHHEESNYSTDDDSHHDHITSE